MRARGRRPTRAGLAILPILFVCAGSARAEPAAPPGIPARIDVSPLLSPALAREDLESFLLRRVPPLVPPESAAGWRKTAARLRRRILSEVIFAGVPRGVSRL